MFLQHILSERVVPVNVVLRQEGAMLWFYTVLWRSVAGVNVSE